MSTKEADWLYYNAFIHKYEADFKENTGKDLTFIILQRLMPKKEPELLPLNLIFDCINSMIPEKIHQINVTGKTITIKTKWGKRELVNLRKIFTKISLDYGYTRNDVIDIFNIDHTTVGFYVKIMNNTIENPKVDMDLFQLYIKATTKIKEVYDQYFQCNHQLQPNSESNVPSLFY